MDTVATLLARVVYKIFLSKEAPGGRLNNNLLCIIYIYIYI